MTIARSAPVRPAGPAATPLMLRELRPGASTKPALALLSDHAGLEDGEWLSGPALLFALTDLAADPEGLPAAAALAVVRGEDEVELRRFAVHPSLAESAVVPRLVAGLADALRAAGRRRLVAGLAPSERSRLALLEDAGLRPVGRPGESRHLVWLALDL